MIATSSQNHVAQVALPLPRITQIELIGANKAIGLAGQAVDTNCIYALEFLGGPKLQRPSVIMAASMIRAAVKTLSDVDEL